MRYGVDDVQTTPSRAGGAVGGTRQHDAPSHVTTAGQGVTRTDDRPLLDIGTSVSTLRGNASASRRHNGLPTRPPDVACVTYSRNFSRDHALDTRISGNSGNDETTRLLGDRGEPIFSLWRDSEHWPRLVKALYRKIFSANRQVRGLRVRMRAPLPLFHCVAPREAARECFSALDTASPTDATHRPPGKHLQTFGLTDAAGKAGNLPVFFGTFYGIGLEIDLEERGVFLTAPIHPSHLPMGVPHTSVKSVTVRDVHKQLEITTTASSRDGNDSQDSDISHDASPGHVVHACSVSPVSDARDVSYTRSSSPEDCGKDGGRELASVVKSRRRRTAFTSEQLLELEKEFHSKKYLSLTERSHIARALRLSEVQRVKAGLVHARSGLGGTSCSQGEQGHKPKIVVPIPVHVNRIAIAASISRWRRLPAPHPDLPGADSRVTGIPLLTMWQQCFRLRTCLCVPTTQQTLQSSIDEQCYRERDFPGAFHETFVGVIAIL
ncbi:hypothetical protein C0Q70_03112 [Pomacea canaliculata]|uniref:Homeobox domain-containing protein n=1 Tax=Pomacea canaliculata TaxID=400727 RepID=A0A2T7PRT7_POMCA|nr:hypothetical protein C0Q70_03112 [Pomacea canaliculata]